MTAGLNQAVQCTLGSRPLTGEKPSNVYAFTEKNTAFWPVCFVKHYKLKDFIANYFDFNKKGDKNEWKLRKLFVDGHFTMGPSVHFVTCAGSTCAL